MNSIIKTTFGGKRIISHHSKIFSDLNRHKKLHLFYFVEISVQF